MRRFGTGRVMSQTRMQAFLRPRDLGEGTRADGLFQGIGDGTLGIVQGRRRLNGQRADDAVIGEVDFQSGSAVIELNAHDGPWVGKEIDGLCIFAEPSALVHCGGRLYHTSYVFRGLSEGTE